MTESKNPDFQIDRPVCKRALGVPKWVTSLSCLVCPCSHEWLAYVGPLMELSWQQCTSWSQEMAPGMKQSPGLCWYIRGDLAPVLAVGLLVVLSRAVCISLAAPIWSVERKYSSRSTNQNGCESLPEGWTEACPREGTSRCLFSGGQGPRSRDVRVTHPNGSRLSSALTNGALSWWQRTEDRGRGEAGKRGEGRRMCIGQNWLPGAGWGSW